MLKKPYEYVQRDDLPDGLHEFVDKYGMDLTLELFRNMKGQTLYFKSICKEPAVIKRCMSENPELSILEIAKHFDVSEQHVRNMRDELELKNIKLKTA